MGRNLGPVLRRELDNLEKDADCRKSAMKALKSYVKNLDSKTIPFFLAQVSERKETSSSAGDYSISLYEVLARVHGPKIVPHIDTIMATIINTLTSNVGSFALYQACSKVVPAIARYGIDPTTPEDKKRQIIHSLCKPLLDSILASQENLSSGSALCLKALVECDNWRFASSEMVNGVCQRVVGALEKHVQTNSHMALVMALAKSNSLVVEAYARLIIQSGLRILGAGVAEDNSQKRLSAIQMVNFLMKCLDPKSLSSELGKIMEEMHKCQGDKMPYVKGAASDALQTAKKIVGENGSNFKRDAGAYCGSSFIKSNNHRRRNLSDADDQLPLFTSPESQTVDSFAGYDSFIGSPIANSYASGDLNYDGSENWQLWRRNENGGVDISFKDGLFTEATSKAVMENECLENGECANEFAGFMQGSPRNAAVRSRTPSPQRSRSHIDVDNVKIFTTPRKLICSLQDSNGKNSDISEKRSRQFRTPCKSNFELSPSKCNQMIQTSYSHHPASMYDQYGVLRNTKHETESKENASLMYEEFQGSSESVSSSETAVGDVQVSQESDFVGQTESFKGNVRKHHPMSTCRFVFGTFVIILSIFICLFWIGSNPDEGYYLHPT